MHIQDLYQLYLQSTSIETDTRKLKAGAIFFALKGENFNGNLFAAKALEKGAIAVVTDEETGINDERILKVASSLAALQQLAKHHRLQLNIPFLAITGSNGKTTTKELIHAVLSTHLKTSTTEGNYNNHIGIPLTLLKVPADAEIAVVEMGANHQQEIAGYCQYTLPTHGLINNVGKAHLEGFGGIEGVKKGKGELYDFIREIDGVIFMNTDFDYLHEMSNGIQQKITYGTHNAQTTGIIKSSDPFLTVTITSHPQVGTIQTQLVGDYNFPNVLAAVSVGMYFKVPAEKIKAAIENYIPNNSRSQMIERNTNHIILDAYNANPSSMKLAIENFAKMNGSKKVVMLGAMAELGSESLQEHQAIIEQLETYSWQQVVLVGKDFLEIPHSFLYFETSDQDKNCYDQQSFQQTFFLIKGSRSMKMETIIS